jgi:hypothetical protein
VGTGDVDAATPAAGEGSIGSTHRLALLTGICGALLVFASLAGWLIVVYPAFLSADEPDHLDHAWRVGHGELPNRLDGIRAPGLPRRPTQLTFQHPPLFYALIAPAVTPLLDGQRPNAAVFVGRVLVLGMGVACLLAVGWATRRVTRRPDPALVVGAVAVAAVVTPLIGVSAAIYNDTLAVLAGVVATGLILTMIRKEPTVWLVAALAGTCAVGFATRASFAAVVLVSAAATAVVIGRAMSQRPWLFRAVAAGVAAAVVVAVPLLTSGWFYARNARLTGNWTGVNRELSRAIGRDTPSLLGAVLDPDVWTRGVANLFATPLAPDEGVWPVRALGLAVIVAIAVLAVLRAHRRLRSGGVESSDYLVAGLLIFVSGATFLQFAAYVSQGGGFSPRYLLPALLPICIGAAYGLLAPSRARGALVVGFVAVNAVVLVIQSTRVLQRRSFGQSVGVWRSWVLGATANDIPTIVLPVLLGSLAAGVVVLAAGLRRVTAPRPAGPELP